MAGASFTISSRGCFSNAAKDCLATNDIGRSISPAMQEARVYMTLMLQCPSQGIRSADEEVSEVVTRSVDCPFHLHCFLVTRTGRQAAPQKSEMQKYWGLRGRGLHAGIWIISCICTITFGYNQAVAGGVLTTKSFQHQFPSIDTIDAEGAEKANRATLQGNLLSCLALRVR